MLSGEKRQISRSYFFAWRTYYNDISSSKIGFQMNSKLFKVYEFKSLSKIRQAPQNNIFALLLLSAVICLLSR